MMKNYLTQNFLLQLTVFNILRKLFIELLRILVFIKNLFYKLVIQCFKLFYETSDFLPPGPIRLPWLGYLPFLGRDLHLCFTKLAKKFGNIYHLYFGNKLVIILNDYDAIREAFVKQGTIFSRRPEMFAMSMITEGYGIVTSDGSLNQTSRKLIQTYQRDVPAVKDKRETAFINEVDILISEINKQVHSPLVLKKLVTCCVANIVNLFMFNTSYSYDDPRMDEGLDLIHDALELSRSICFGLVETLPMVRKLPGFQHIINYIMNIKKRVQNMISERVKMDFTQEEYTFINYLKEVIPSQLEWIQNGHNLPINLDPEKQLNMILWDIHTAAIETTSHTLDFAFLYMTVFPEVQKKVQEELDRVVGHNRLPNLNDRPNLPYTEAVICEVQRYSSVTPLGAPHSNSQTTILKGYTIPEGAMIFPNLWAVHHDPKHWSHPEHFNPEHFLNDEGKFYKPESFMPYSIGKRRCIGEEIAKMTMFFIFTHVLSNFSLQPADPNKLPSIKGISGLTICPQSYKVRVFQRD